VTERGGIASAKVKAERDISYEVAASVFLDPMRLDFKDAHRDYGEERRITIGRVGKAVLTLAQRREGPIQHRLDAHIGMKYNCYEHAQHVMRGRSLVKPDTRTAGGGRCKGSAADGVRSRL